MTETTTAGQCSRINPLTPAAGAGPRLLYRYLAMLVAGLASWVFIYRELGPFSRWFTFDVLHFAATTRLGSAVQFFLFDAPKVIMLLVLVVFFVGIIRTFFTPARTRTIVEEIMSALSAPASSLTPTVSWDKSTEFLVVVHDKYEFRIPKEGYWFNENDLWVRLKGNRARVGISDYMQQRLTDINYFDPPQTGAVLEQFGELGTVESTKAVFEVVSPVGGRVVTTNQTVEESPELVNEDPYGRGWLVEMELTDWQSDQELLLGGAAYADTVERKAAEE